MNGLPPLQPLEHLDPARFEIPAVLKKLVSAHRQLAEFKGVASSMPNQAILVSTLGLQEAKDSSEIENIVTTHDELFREAAFSDAIASAATREVARYRQALGVGYDSVRGTELLTVNQILAIQAELEKNRAGLRKLPGTVLQDAAGRTVYTPPSPEHLPGLMTDLERFRQRTTSFPRSTRWSRWHSSITSSRASIPSTMATAARAASSMCFIW